MYVTRTIEPHIQRATQQFPVVWLTGARQVGKTTLLKHISADTRSFVTLDDPLVLNLAKTDPALFLQRFPPPVLIDEVQRVTGTAGGNPISTTTGAKTSVRLTW